ncbi:hypothetical protein GJ496_005959 [Pomphorhynchus laevis]|nr:hypothetical protein GJ496_005959 [Pomphorhynchus laevis]
MNTANQQRLLKLDLKCGVCQQNLKRGEAMQIYKDVHYHPECFRCSTCKRSIAGQAFFPKADDIFMCEQCNDNLCPICVYCRQKIPAGVKAKCYEGQRYHSQCFKCDKCDVPIPDNMNFVDLLNGSFRCLNCSHHMTMGHTGTEHAPDQENVHGTLVLISPDLSGRVPLCDKCKQPILAGSEAFNHIDRHYHLPCSTCNRCRRKVLNVPCRKLGSALVCHTCS